MAGYVYKPYDYVPPPELAAGATGAAGAAGVVAVAIVGAGPVGLAAAIDLALHGVASVVLDDNNVVSAGSRAICWARRSLDILGRLGVGQRMVAKGVTWQVGRLFHGDAEVYNFDLAPDGGHKMPAFINLQQYYVEDYLVDRCRAFPDRIDLRWKNRVVGLTQDGDGATLRVETPDGGYDLRCRYVLACDGARSSVRAMLGLAFDGHSFEERFLIADVEMTADFPPERWFWFKPSFHPGQTALLHKQPDNIFRIDLQLGWDAAPEVERQPESVIPRIQRAVGGRPFALDWVSVYRFRCARLRRFVHDRVLFAGDSAHVVSPFGARGGNGGLHDVDNLCWKLALVLRGLAGPGLLDSYDAERGRGADENIRQSTRATEFMSPPDGAARLFRDQTLALAATQPFARRLINSGRLSDACSLAGLPLQTPDETGRAPVTPGTVCPDAPLPDGGWLLDRLGGGFALLAVGPAAEGAVAGGAMATDLPVIAVPDNGPAADHYGHGVYLIRPDQHVAAWWEAPSAGAIRAAVQRASGFVG